jgi:hypothetical protein
MDQAHAAIGAARRSVTMFVELQAGLDDAAEYLDLGTAEGAYAAYHTIGRVLVARFMFEEEDYIEHISAVKLAETRARVILVLRCLGTPSTDKHAFEVNVSKAFGRSLLPYEQLQMHEGYEMLVTLAMSPIFVGDFSQLLPVQ